MDKKVYIIILTFNNSKDTIECLESALKLSYQNYQIIVCDNDSREEEVEKIAKWIEGKGEKVKLIKNGRNLGYAGGNNVGIKLALEDKETKCVWIINDDVVLDKDALTNLVSECESDENIGLCGSKIIYFYDKDKIQTVGGGVYNKWLATSGHIYSGESVDTKIDKEEVLNNISYIAGVSVLATREFIENVGLMKEDYFLYFEESDWAIRAKGKYKLGVALESIVYHKEGATIGSSDNPKKKQKSVMADYYGLRNRVLFTKRYFKYCLPTVYLGLLVAIVNRVLRGQFDRIGMIVKIMLGIKTIPLNR